MAANQYLKILDMMFYYFTKKSCLSTHVTMRIYYISKIIIVFTFSADTGTYCMALLCHIKFYINQRNISFI